MELEGVWVVYSWDMTPQVYAIYADELSALRQINSMGYGTVAFVHFGVDFNEEVKHGG